MFRMSDGSPVPAVTADQMREVDRIAVDEFGLGILQMMENAGRNLALHVVHMLRWDGECSELASNPAKGHLRVPQVTILAGSGGNGGGGLCCARHLHNRGFTVHVVLTKEAEELQGAAARQLRILRRAGVHPVPLSQVDAVIRRSDLVVDALIGYSLRGAPRGRVAELIRRANTYAARVISLDLPSGLDATTGETPGAVVEPERTLTLALPKTGLRGIPGELFLADIGIPPAVYAALGTSFQWQWPCPGRYWLQLYASKGRQ